MSRKTVRRRGTIVVGASERRGGALESHVSIEGKVSRLRFALDGADALPLDDPFLAPAYVLGMRRGADVRIEGPVSRPLLASLPAVRDNLRAWYPRLADVAVDAPNAVDPPPRRGRGVACFFSGGLDSFYSVLKRPEEVTHLVFVHGFDLALGEADLRRRVASSVRAAAEAMGKPLIEVETNLREVSDPIANWTWFCHAGLTAVALLVSDGFDEVRVAATIADAHRPPELRGQATRTTWENGLATIASDGTEATRPQKAAVVARFEAACRWLRVCWENRGGAYNCGACPKCLRTKVALEAAGVRERFPGFAGPLDLAAVAALPTILRSDRRMLEECLWECDGHPEHEALSAAIRRALRRGRPGWLRPLLALRR